MRQSVQTAARLFERAGVEMEISEYPIAAYTAALAQGIFIAQISAIVGLLGQAQYQQMFAVWMSGNFVRQLLTQTGAFEVWYGDYLLWSSLVEGRLPHISELVSRFAQVGVILSIHP